MDTCLFCKIGKKDIEAKMIAESENFFCFLDIHPLVPGHTVVVPKEHIENFAELPLDLSRELIDVMQQSMHKLSRALETKDFTLGVNEGPLAGRVVHHLHVHIMPRFEKDNGGSIHSVVLYENGESLDSIYNKITTS